MNLCMGDCEEHAGEVKRFNVVDKKGSKPYDWGDYWYCEEAVRCDTERGFLLTEITEEQG